MEVAERISAPQWSSTRTIYKSKWALFEKWCRENLVDFSTPSVQKISDFFMYLYLTLKTPFLLALASGKHRSEIHDWVANKVSNLGQWKKVALFPSSDFIAKNQLAREGSQSMAPVTIPASTTIVDRQSIEDRTLCPVQALRYYLDQTKDLRGFRSVLFISFKKGHQTRYTLFLVKTNHFTLLQTSRPTSLGLGPSQSA